VSQVAEAKNNLDCKGTFLLTNLAFAGFFFMLPNDHFRPTKDLALPEAEYELLLLFHVPAFPHEIQNTLR
jgi:hypothetical protein